MKCEICHKADAQTALENGEEELYVCNECARKAKANRKKKSQRTRKIQGLPPGVEMSVTQIGGDGEEPPPILEAIMNVFHGAMSDLEQAQQEAKKAAKKEKSHEFPSERVEKVYRVGSCFHLEGLHLIGELEAVHRAMRALGMRLEGLDADGVKESGHIYRMHYTGGVDRAKRVAEDILEQEHNARVRLMEEMPRVFGDSLCRALAILKNCRLLSPGELFDLLSPLRLAALVDMLDGITLKEIDEMMGEIDMTSAEDRMEQGERDRIDAERADEMNARFEDVMLNDRGEEKFK